MQLRRSSDPMQAEILAVGSELLLGETIDTNSAYLAKYMASMGINVFRKAVVGDNQYRIAEMIEEALGRVDLLICTGGLGPTVDDVTREAVAQAVGRPLEFQQHLLDQIEARFRSFGRTMSPSNRRQAFIPQGARIVENPRGTAPSFIVEEQRGTVVVLPGVPSEMRYLWENAIVPYLRDERGETSTILVRTVHAAGLGESVIGELLEDMMQAENPTLGISAKRAQYELRIGARANSQEEANALADAAERTIRDRLGDAIIGNEKLEQQVGRMMQEQRLTLAVVEPTLSAPLYRILIDNPAWRSVLRGVSISPQPVATSISSADTLASELAQTAREQWHADLGIAMLAAGEAGSDGFTEVRIALAYANGIEIWERRVEMASEEGWSFAATTAMDQLRHWLGHKS